MAFRFPNYPKFPKEFCGAARASLPLRVSRVTPSGAARTARVEGGSGPGGRGRGGARPDSCRPRPARDSQGIGRQGFVGLGGLRLAFCAANRSRSIARGRRAAEGGADRPLRAFGRSRLSGPPSGTERGSGRRTHYAAPTSHPPTRVREWVSYEADPGGGLPARVPCDDCTEWMYCRVAVGAVPRVAWSGRWGLWVAARSAAAHSRDLVCCVNRVEVIPSK